MLCIAKELCPMRLLYISTKIMQSVNESRSDCRYTKKMKNLGGSNTRASALKLTLWH